MKVILAKHAGFCMGVRRAVETALDTVHKEINGIATFGPLIHNPQVLDMLEEKGVKTLKDIPEKIDGTVIIRAHGVPPSQKEDLLRSGARVQDATCPRVMKVQAIISKHKKEGYSTVIIGDKDHAEVTGLMGYAAPMGILVSNAADVAGLHINGPYIIVSQTTQDERTFEKLKEMILTRFPGGKVFNTICDSTHKRQEEVKNICAIVEAVVVVGGSASANTQRLGEIVTGMNRPVFMVETEKDLDLESLCLFNCVGVTAGASTPSWVINRVMQTLESLPGYNENFLRTFLRKTLWFLLTTNLYVSLGGGALFYTATKLQGHAFSWTYFLIATGYFCHAQFKQIVGLEIKAVQ